MTQPPDDPNDPRDRNSDRGGSGDPGAGRRLDEDAAWRAIVENYGEPALDPPSENDSPPAPAPDPEPEPP
ncbi:MAG TPA: hypothetical protein VFZ64_14855, partial [Nocardioidaceae bacterium]